MTSLILGYIIYYSSFYNLDPLLVRAVIEIESRGDMHKVGAAGEVGLMQLLPKSFPNKKISNIKVNIKLGVSYLAEVKKYCPHQIDNTWLVCYNIGVAGSKKIKYPKKFPYYKNVIKEYQRLTNEIKDLPIQTSQ